MPRLDLECVSLQEPDSLVAVGIWDLYLLHEEREDDLVRAITTADRDSMLVWKAGTQNRDVLTNKIACSSYKSIAQIFL